MCQSAYYAYNYGNFIAALWTTAVGGKALRITGLLENRAEPRSRVEAESEICPPVGASDYLHRLILFFSDGTMLAKGECSFTSRRWGMTIVAAVHIVFDQNNDPGRVVARHVGREMGQCFT